MEEEFRSAPVRLAGAVYDLERDSTRVLAAGKQRARF
jgi:hypothetical protein